MSRVIEAFAQFFDGGGDPLIDGWLKFVESGTTSTDKDTYSDSAETIANANPVQLDAEGRAPSIFGTGVYRVYLYTNDVLLNQPDVQIDMFDPVGGISSDNMFDDWVSSTSYAINSIVTGPDGNYYKSLENDNLNNTPASNPDSWEEIDFIQYWNTNITYSEFDVVTLKSTGFRYISLQDSNTGHTPGDGSAWWDEQGVSKTDTETIAGVKTFSSFPITPSSAPTTDYQASNKKYTDDEVQAAKNYAATLGIIQTVQDEVLSVQTGTTLFILDDTKPQITEGNEFFSQAITPTSATNILEIELQVCGDAGGGGTTIAAVFQDTTADCIVSVGQRTPSTELHILTIRYRMVAGTTSATTFKARVGGTVAGTYTLNGVVGSRQLGGSLSSTLTITEIKA